MKITDVTNCSRCGGIHHEVEAQRLDQPFAPVEASPTVWTHWFPCPTNGQPVLVVKVEGDEDQRCRMARQWFLEGFDAAKSGVSLPDRQKYFDDLWEKW